MDPIPLSPFCSRQSRPRSLSIPVHEMLQSLNYLCWICSTNLVSVLFWGASAGPRGPDVYSLAQIRWEWSPPLTCWLHSLQSNPETFGLLCNKGRWLTQIVVHQDLQGTRIVWFITFSGVEVGLTGLLLLGFSILKTGVMFAFFQFSGTSLNCHDLSELVKSGLALRLRCFLGSYTFILSGPRDWCVSRLSVLQPDSPSQRASLLPLVSGAWEPQAPD